MVLVGTDRGDLAAIAGRHLGAEVAILDDGFQHLALERDLDVVVLDGAAPFGNGKLLPRGPLREGPAALERAGLGWIAKCDEGEPARVEAAAREIEKRIGRPPVRSRYRVSRVLAADLQTEHPRGTLAGQPVLLLAGVARPGSFRRTLEHAGARVVDEACFPDHHAFTRREVEGVLARARAVGAELVCCTEKDAVRLPPELHGGDRLVVVQVETEIVAGAETLAAALDRALGRQP
jgi:tetraacyldisaccharide 4'-kinase